MDLAPSTLHRPYQSTRDTSGRFLCNAHPSLSSRPARFYPLARGRNLPISPDATAALNSWTLVPTVFAAMDRAGCTIQISVFDAARSDAGRNFPALLTSFRETPQVYSERPGRWFGNAAVCRVEAGAAGRRRRNAGAG